jgi:GxxExxY protein
MDTQEIKKNINELTEKIIGCAIEVHKHLGPGLLESVYHNALCYELRLNEIHFVKEKASPAIYKEQLVGDFYIDILAEDKVVLELKSVEKHDPLFDAQILNYMRLGNYKLGLLINFNSKMLRDGIKMFVL